jgi:carboxylesterase
MQGSEPIFINNNAKIGVLMLHGFSSTPNEFKELSVYLSKKGFNVYAPLIAGHGTIPEDLSKTNPQDWLNSAKDAYIKLKKISERVFIVGNSFGSNLAFWLVKELNNEPMGIATLGAPIFLKHHFFVVCRIYSYGLIQTYYQKPPRLYKTDYIDMEDQVTYAAIPTKSIRQFLQFIKKETRVNLGKVTIPALVAHAKIDPVVNPSSATYIYSRLGSQFKKIYWFPSNFHIMTIDSRRQEIFKKIFEFIQEII